MLIGSYAAAMPEFAPPALIFVLFTFVVWALLALGFLMIAARVVTRVVLDEIDKNRRRRGPV
jgi:uncharacterized membrane protein YecN with MAPEG domain